MTGKNIGIWIFTLLLTSTIVITGCSNVGANKRSNPVGAETDSESIVTAGTASYETASGTTRNTDPNLLPVVNVFASQNTVGAGTDVNLRAEAIDPAGSPVTIEWESSDGILTSVSGSSAVWQAPAYTSNSVISCIATNARGGRTQADVKIDVIGNSTYKLNILIDRCCLAAAVSDSSDSDFVPVAGARVILKAFDDVGITDKNGNVEFNVTQAERVASYSDIEVSYKDWDVTYNAKLISISGSVVKDNLIFSPGYESLSVAQASGDSFEMKKGLVEVATTEKNTIGGLEILPEVCVNCSVSSVLSSRDTGIATIQTSVANKETSISLSKTGYSTIEGCTIPVSQTSTTLVAAEMVRNCNICDYDASISYIKPYNYKQGVSVMEPFIIGFNQPMETSTVFENITIMVQNKTSGRIIPMNSAEIKDFFDIKWKGSSLVYLYPKTGYAPSSRYSILINNWTARTIDGRYLKPYIGTYYEFTTDADPQPQILAFEPANGATGVSRNGPFCIYFDRAIDPESLYNDTKLEVINVTSGMTVTLTGSMIRSYFSVVWKDGNTTLQLVPSITLNPFNAYQIRLKKCSFKSASGQTISGLENFWTQFTTGGM